MKKLSSLINSELTKKTQVLGRIDEILKSVLPLAGHAHIQTANLVDTELTVITDTPVWSTRLRLYTQDMLYMLSKHTEYGITSIRIRSLRNHPATAAKKTSTPTLLSHRSADLIEKTAVNITDPELKQSLLQLARRKKFSP